jgi:Cytochrome c oxidase subunit IV
MKQVSRILILLGVFFLALAIVYWFMSKESGGSIMIFAGSLLCFMPGSYYGWWAKRMAPHPQDSKTGDHSEAAGVVATFPGTSIWPFTLGMGAFFTVLALVFGIWLLLPGLALVVWALLGGTAEGRRGGHH